MAVNFATFAFSYRGGSSIYDLQLSSRVFIKSEEKKGAWESATSRCEVPSLCFIVPIIDRFRFISFYLRMLLHSHKLVLMLDADVKFDSIFACVTCGGGGGRYPGGIIVKFCEAL